MTLKDPTAWLEDLNHFIDDEELADTAAAMEDTLVLGTSKWVAAAWVAVAGVVAGGFGSVTLHPSIRQSVVVFAGYLIGAALLLRGMYPLAARLHGRSVAWLAMFTFSWASLLGVSVALAGRIDSALWGYLVACGGALFIGLMHGSFAPGFVRNEDVWMMVALPLAPVGAAVATWVLRNVPGSSDSLGGAALVGALAGGCHTIPLAVVVATLASEAHGLGRMGLLYLHNDNFAPKALAFLDRAIALAPRDAALYNLRGIAWSKMDEPERAAADWRTVTELTPRDPEAHLNLGVDFMRQGALDQAVEVLRRALAIDPEHARAHSNLGAALERQGALDQAIEHYDRAIAREPEYANAFSNRAYAYFRKGEHQRALEDSERAIALEDKLGMAHVNRGHALAALGRTAEARQSYGRAMSVASDPTVQAEAVRGLEGLGSKGPGDEPA